MAMDPGAPFQPGTGSVPATKVEITVSCRLDFCNSLLASLPESMLNHLQYVQNAVHSMSLTGTKVYDYITPILYKQHWLPVNLDLKDKDVMSKSDPMCVLYTTKLGARDFAEYERTEMIKNTLNPDFVKKFILTYFFEECQRLKFEIHDVDSPSHKLNSHDFLGKVETTLGEILGSSNNRLEKPLVGAGKKCGTIIISAEEVSDCKDRATLSFCGHKLDKKDFLGKSDPFMVFYRCNEDNSYTICHKTEIIKNTLNPTWRPFPVLVRSLCNGDVERTIKVECFDWDSDGSHDLIGIFTTNMRQISTGRQTYELINPKKKAKKKSYKNSGTIELTNCVIEKQNSFLDYIKGGMQINFTVAIDFTASNGNPTHSNSLHYINPYQPNHYEIAISSVGEVIQDYDTDKLFPVLGFGAKLPPDGRVSHEFSVNFNPQSPFCSGIPGIMQAYQSCIRAVQLYGPTNFAPIINHVAQFAQAYPDGSNYFILLIITDGVISDMEMTKEAIIRASTLPMSIIIIGVGPAEFDAMEELDADKKALAYRGKVAERDIVQFVPFREYVGGVGSGNQHLSQARLAKDVLAEVPEQIIAFMKKNGLTPIAAPQPHIPLTVPPSQ